MPQIEVVPYDIRWHQAFETAKEFYGTLLRDIPCEIVHVGSTSIKGLWAKPILDIDIIVDKTEQVKQVIDRLATVGYRHQGDMGIKGREAFDYDPMNPKINWMRHHLYVCLRGIESLENHLLLKRHLENHPEAVERYSLLKQQLAKKYGDDIDGYISEKTALITEFLEAEGMASEAIQSIKKANVT